MEASCDLVPPTVVIEATPKLSVKLKVALLPAALVFLVIRIKPLLFKTVKVWGAVAVHAPVPGLVTVT